MPAVFSITMALGALALSKQKAIVSRLAAIEEMAGVDILCTDKTGTLTKNQLNLGDPILFAATDPEPSGARRPLALATQGPTGPDRLLRDRGAEGPNADQASPADAFDPVRPGDQADASDRQGRAGRQLHRRQGHAGGGRRSGQARCRRPRTSSSRRSAQLAAKGTGRSPSPAPSTATAAGPFSACCRCSTRRATTPRRRSTRSRPRASPSR